VTPLKFPDQFNQITTYPIAPLAAARQAELAQAFVTTVLSAEGQQILASYGFIPAAGASAP
jgi:molybdate transport system substrate-binding protein